MRIFGRIALTALAFLAGAGPAPAGQPMPWQMGFQRAASPMRESMDGLHDFLLVIITSIVLFVFVLLIWVMVRYNKRANPTPARFTHSTAIEVVWTLIPILIVGSIAIWSYRVLETVEKVPPADMTLKVTGNQWNWTYAYPDDGGFEFTANRLPDSDLGKDYFGHPQPRLLATDEDTVVPVGKVVRVQVTATDVLHSFAVPAFGVKMDAVPGMLNETWFKVDKPGMYYGQCSEICGIGHSFMPIAIRAVNEEEFDAWAAEKRAELAQ